ncbi:hypothetical protein FGG08_000392 [Glutinoglossum americanum]|uniref:UNC-45/Cro1/She4 central domain-containing protein n=1 Tax=Glutinoglossum americanum TaxID=1670608 RepID=A0A9P8L3V3_9PEZI|nr:hypothetical protein FGG08_000392 [Glutinoglossum americanum]
MPGEDEARASQLAKRALELVSSGQLEDGARTLREAASISPENADVRASFLSIQQDKSVSTLLKLCRKLVFQHDENAGREALRFLERPDVQISDSDGNECANLLFDHFQSLKTSPCGEIVGRLLKQSLSARKYVAQKLQDETTELFSVVWSLGSDAIQGLVVVSLDPSAWASEPSRQKCEGRIFELLLTKLTQQTKVNKTVAIKAISRLIAADSPRLHSLVRESNFDTILSLLDIREPEEIRSQATLATAKYLEASQESGQKMLSKFALSKVSRGASEDLIVAFSTASSVFLILPSAASVIFLTEGFVESLIPLLERNGKSAEVQRAALEMLSAACIDPSCREAIGKACSGWLTDVVELSKGQNAGLAAVVLAKVRGAGEPVKQGKGQSAKEETEGVEELVGMFKDMMAKEDDDAVQRSIEGLAYNSLQPKVKEELANDKPFLRKLFDILNKSSGKSTLTFGGLTIVANLTNYLPNLSDEQKRLGQLKAYANAKKAKMEPDPLDKEDRVTTRCKKVLDAGIVPVLASSSKKVSPTALGLILSILLSLSRHQKHRGQIAQQGGVKLLLQAHASITSTTAQDSRASVSAAHALARILISTNPAHVFSSALPISLAIRPLLSLLDDEDSEQRDLLPIFESLLALTNLASTDDDTRDLIIRVGWPRIEELLLASALIQRATVELVCNLMASPTGVAKFADGTRQAGNRLHILLALADMEDYETRRAAGGALAMLTEWDAAVQAVLARDRGVTILLELCREEKDELRHRGVVCVRNVVCASGEAGRAGMQKVKGEGGVEVLKGMLRETRNTDVLQIGVEALKAILQEGQ